ncbi:MAG: hypothetical protein Kow0067_17200 [Coriobacteriia bacterium]
MALPVDVRDLLKAGDRIRKDREQPVRLAIVVEVDASDVLIDGLRDRMRPATSAASLQIEVAEPGQPIDYPESTDAVIAAVGSGTTGIETALAPARARRVPVVAVALGEPSTADVLADRLLQPTADLLVDDDIAHLLDDELGDWLVDSLGHKRLALAANFGFLRRAVAEDAVRTTSWQNGLVGAVALIPGADMPIMTANQAKMLLQIAAAYGEHLGPERIRELAVIVGGGLAFRALARQLLTAVPVLGWAVKGGIGYGGTAAMGKAAIAYFEQGADLGQVALRLKEEAGQRFTGARTGLSQPPRAGASSAPEPAQQPALPGTEPGVDG